MKSLKDTLCEILQPIEQDQLLAGTEEWSTEQFEQLKREIQKLDLVRFCQQQQHLQHEQKAPLPFNPLTNHFPNHHQENYEKGIELAKAGKCGCIVLGGGQASRLRLEGPKGCVPISRVQNKTLFQLIAEKVAAASAQVERPLPLAFMTSTMNRMATETYFIENHFFGLRPNQTSFFSQCNWPLLTLSGNLFFQKPGTLAMGPNGNGDFFRAFVANGIWQKWADQGIEMVRIMAVDNPLALPFDYELFGFHERQNNELSIQTIKKTEPTEKVGTLTQVKQTISVLEYGEFTDTSTEQYANIGLYCFSMDFIKKASEMQLPMHRAKKAVKMWPNEEIPKEPNAWKFEEFVFDAFLAANRAGALIFPREQTFAPVKNTEGEDSLQTAQQAVLSHEKELFKEVSGQMPPESAEFELSAEFYYPTEAFKEKWQGKPLPQSPYVD